MESEKGSGQPPLSVWKADTSTWTNESLYIHFNALIRTLGDNTDDHFATLEKLINVSIDAQKDRAEQFQKSNEHWQENANKWRALLTERERDFFPRNLGYVFMIATILEVLFSIWKTQH